MASFTDQIPQFNPYIQQMPIEAMTQVGVYKQQKYDEGLQKIQSQIENIAGLDVYHDSDKQYLQSKLNELGGKLKTVAAGDFSNFQLVNSVGGMATQIGKDPLVQNAVASTTWYRKQAALMEKAIEEGKASQANIYDFNNKVNSWLSKNEAGQKFTSRYTPYNDVTKKALEAIKALHPKLNQYDIPFEIDSQGNINTRKVADAMKRYKIEGIDENQIKQAISAVMTPDDVNQLQIDANYRFREISSDDLIRVANENYKTKKEDAIETLNYLKTQKSITSDPTKSSEIDSKIDYYNKLLGIDGVKGTLDEELEYNVTKAKENPDAVKLSIYKDAFIKQLANGFSWKNQVESYEKSPLREQLNWAADMKFKQQVENRHRYEFSVTSSQKEREIELDRQRVQLQAESNALKRIELYGDPNVTNWTELSSETDNKLRSKEYLTDHITSLSDSINSDLNKLGTKYSRQQIDEMLADWKKNGNKATKVRPDAIELLQQIARKENDLAGWKEKEEVIKNQARKEVLSDDKYARKSAEINNNLKRLDSSIGGVKLNITGKEGDDISLNPSKLVKDIKEGRATLSVDKAPLGEIRLSYTINGKPYVYEISKSAFGVDKVGAKELRPILLGVSEHLNKFGGFEKEIDKTVNDLYLEKLSPLTKQFVPQIKAVAKDKSGKLPSALKDNIEQLLIAAEAGKYAANDDYKGETAQSMLSDENVKDTNIFIYRKGDTYEVHIKNKSLDQPTQILKLNKNDVSTYFGSGYVSDKTTESMRLGMGAGNTNLTGNPERSLMQKSFGDFPGIERLNVTADLNENLSNSNLFTPSVNIKKKNGRWENFEIAGKNKMQYLGYDQAKKQLNNQTDDSLIKLLMELYPNYDFSQLDY
jgi:hypothetical protein